MDQLLRRGRGQLGRVCPIETPEGTNIGRVLSIATGAEIRDGKLVVTDDSPTAALGLSASMIPFLEHNDANRALMGANMMRQWLVPDRPEPALVQTGHEPDEPGFWCGRNLLTAFVSWGPDTFEDGILTSESAAGKLGYHGRLAPGDKLSNRHGTKGVVSRVLPDDQMPHLPDGTAVELVFNFVGCHTRLNFGQVREAVLGFIARAEGQTVVVPPFQAPSAEEIRSHLKSASLPESGMQTLTMGKGGPKLRRPSTVGWVYWGKTFHLAANKIHASTEPSGCQLQAELEYYCLRDAGAFETLAETYNTRSVDRADADTLAARVAARKTVQADPPTPTFSKLAGKLAAAGVRCAFDGKKVALAFAPPEGGGLKLARPVPHPWLGSMEIDEVGRLAESPAFENVVQANSKLERLSSDRAPGSLVGKATDELTQAVTQMFGALLQPSDLHLSSRVLFSGRTVIAPASGITLDQLGLPYEIAWIIFGPKLAGKVGEKDVAARNDKAAAALDEAMAQSWVLLNRAPSVLPTSILAFRPVGVPDSVIRLHPLACKLLNADFDGDQSAVFLPITEATQTEAAEKLSIAGHLRRDPELIDWLIPTHDILWGLAELSISPDGRRQINELAGAEVAATDGYITRDTLGEAVESVMAARGVEGALAALQRLMDLGFETAKRSGASLSPFAGESLDIPPAPADDDDEAWELYVAQIVEQIAGRTDFEAPDLGPQLLAAKSGARGSIETHLLSLIGARGPALNFEDRQQRIRHGCADGMTPDEYFAWAGHARKALGQVAMDTVRRAYELGRIKKPKGFGVLARAMRSARPGVVFARAAAMGEMDPLAGLDSRLFVGLP